MQIISRKEWGAKYADGFKLAQIPAQEVFLHHSVTTAPGSDREAEAQAMRTLERIGQTRFGGGISYTWAVMPSGRVYQGHAVNKQGAHTRGHNTIARAIVLVGDYDQHTVADQQKQSIAELLRYAKAQDWITKPRLTGGHRQASGAQTECPGRYGMAAIADINALASGEVTDVALTEKDKDEIANRVLSRLVDNYKGDNVSIIQILNGVEQKLADLRVILDKQGIR